MSTFLAMLTGFPWSMDSALARGSRSLSMRSATFRRNLALAS